MTFLASMNAVFVEIETFMYKQVLDFGPVASGIFNEPCNVVLEDAESYDSFFFGKFSSSFFPFSLLFRTQTSALSARMAYLAVTNTAHVICKIRM